MTTYIHTFLIKTQQETDMRKPWNFWIAKEISL